MDSYCHYLRAFFGKSSLPTETKWQPSITNSYINLAVISREKVTHKELEHFMLATLHGDVDEILEVKEPIVIEHIFDSKPGKALQCVLAEGAPGVGKTTLAWQVCHRWGKGELFQQYDLVVLVKLREEVVRKAKTLANLLIYQEDERTTVEIAEYLKQTNGKKVLVILEGLDELPISLLTQQSIFTKLLSGTLLPSATILVTSRPSATVELWNKWKCRISRHIEVLGFSKDNIAEYISTNVDDDERKNFERYLSINPHIRSLMYVPINCTIVIAVYEDCLYHDKPHPKTVTELYTCLVESILRRYLKDNGFNDNIKSFASLPPSVHANFCALTKLAYEGVMTQQYIYNKKIEHLGLMDVVAEEHPFDSYNLSYNFLHLSIQEYLAACYISVMPSHEQGQILQEVCHMKHLRNMCLYLGGITKFEGVDRVILTDVIENEFSKNLDEQEESRRLEMSGIIHDLLKAIERLMEQISGRKEEVEIAGDLLEATNTLFKLTNKKRWVKQKKDEWKIAIRILSITERLVSMKQTKRKEDRWETANNFLNATERFGKLINRELKEVGKWELDVLMRIDKLYEMSKLFVSERRPVTEEFLKEMQEMINRYHKLPARMYDKIGAAMDELSTMTGKVLDLSTYALQLLCESEAISVLDCKEYKCTLSDYNSPVDFFALGYCISHSNCSWWLQLGDSGQYMQVTEGIEMLAKKLQSRQRSYTIKTFIFCHNNPQLLRDFPDHTYLHLESLQLEFPPIELRPLQPLPPCMPVLISRMVVLRCLTISGTTIDSVIDVLHSLVNISKDTLEVLHLATLSFNRPAMEALCCALDFHGTSICSLILSYCGITDEQASILRKILGKLKLNDLDLSDNHIHDKEAVAIAEATPLSIVTLRGNPISDKGKLAKYENVYCS